MLKSHLCVTDICTECVKYVNKQTRKNTGNDSRVWNHISCLADIGGQTNTLFTVQYINHGFDPSTYWIPWQWLPLNCEPMCVKSHSDSPTPLLPPWGNSPAWRAGKYLNVCVNMGRLGLTAKHLWTTVLIAHVNMDQCVCVSVCGSFKRVQVWLFARWVYHPVWLFVSDGGSSSYKRNTVFPLVWPPSQQEQESNLPGVSSSTVSSCENVHVEAPYVSCVLTSKGNAKMCLVHCSMSLLMGLEQRSGFLPDLHTEYEGFWEAVLFCKCSGVNTYAIFATSVIANSVLLYR